ncbi:hypothetical protein K502DRAFT_57024 [Neoconidiobolus thromboides FSU 785]|nr:hypothetical protein K502DRAFT_57024 [Neoconidiobolus thromboides FSU 785]
MKQVIQLLLQQFVKVNKEYKFPILDLLRYLSSFIDLEKEFNVIEYLNNHLYSNIKPFDKMTDILLMISFKLISNLLLVNQTNNALVCSNMSLLLQQLNIIEPFINQSSINCNLAYSSIFVNLSQLNPNVTNFTVENINEFLLLLNELLLIDHEELNYRSFVAIYNVYLNYQKYHEDIKLLLEQLEMPTRIQKEFVVKYKNNTKISGLLNKLYNLL